MIDDIIEFVDNEDEECVIIFVDQQKAFDRMEWGWLNYVMECFNFGLKFHRLCLNNVHNRCSRTSLSG
jgi:hypothetical protein